MSAATGSLKFEYLADRPEWVPLIVDWWAAVWADRMGADLERVAGQLHASLSKDELPVHIVAVRGAEPVGTAALKLQELPDLFPDYRYWLGNVFVAGPHRGGGIASALSRRVIEIAVAGELPHLHLQTVNLSGGLYRHLGWEPVKRFCYRNKQTLLMKKKLD